MTTNLLRTIVATFVFGFVGYTAYAYVNCECMHGSPYQPPDEHLTPTGNKCIQDVPGTNAKNGACNGAATDGHCNEGDVEQYNPSGWDYTAVTDENGKVIDCKRSQQRPWKSGPSARPTYRECAMSQAAP